MVIPTRNRWDVLRTALASALAQRDVAVEVVVVDDGSSDRTQEELRLLRDDRVLVLRHEHPRGVSAARNAGLQRVTAPWVAFLDDDDVWAPGHQWAMLAAIRRSQLPPERVGLAFSGHLDIDGRRHVTNVSPAAPAEAVPAGLRSMNIVGGPSRVLLRTGAVREVGGFDERLSTLADWDLWVRVLERYAAVRCPELLVGYMTHEGNMQLDAERFLADLVRLEEKHGWRPGELRGAVLPRHLAGLYRRSGRRFRAARWYARAFRAGHRPRDLGRAVGVLLGEPIIALSRLRRRSTVDPSLGWWLEALREAERTTTTGLPQLPGTHHERAMT